MILKNEKKCLENESNISVKCLKTLGNTIMFNSLIKEIYYLKE